MDNDTLGSKLVELILEITPDSKVGTPEYLKNLKSKTVSDSDIDDLFYHLQFCVKYNMFDIEACRRELAQFKPDKELDDD